jgi:hypothetical protein
MADRDRTQTTAEGPARRGRATGAGTSEPTAVDWWDLEGWDVDAPIATKAILVRGRLSALGLLGELTSGMHVKYEPGASVPTPQTIIEDLHVLSDAGLSRGSVAAFLAAKPTPQSLGVVLDDALDALENNPMPATEWAAVRHVLGDELLGSIADVSSTSMRRYATGERPTPDDVAARLHFVALVNADLAGSYNELGVRRWWQRPRSQLAGLSPIEALGESWDPDKSESASTVRALAASLAGAGSAT